MKKNEYSFLSLLVTDFHVRTGISLNHEVINAKLLSPETTIYQQYSSIELHCRNIDPDYLTTDTYQFSLYGHPLEHSTPELTLANFHVKDDKGVETYRRVKGRDVPIYNVPKGINTLTKRRGSRHWSSALWLKPQIVSDMVTLLSSDKDLYVACHLTKIERVQWLIGFDMQTENPLDC